MARKIVKSKVKDLFTPSRLQSAINYARKHPEETFSAISRRFEVDRTTLRRRVQGTQQARDIAHQHQQLFSPGEELSIVEWCEEMDRVGFPVTHDLITQMAQSILNKRPEHEHHTLGDRWSHRFLARNPQLESKFAYYQEKSRQYSSSNEIAQIAFYRLLRNTMRRLEIKECHVWNCDEKGIIMGKLSGKEKVIVRAGTKRPTLLTDASREFVSTLETINITEEVLPPFIVWQGKTHRRGMYRWGGVHERDATFTATPSGYMDDEAGFEYILEHFDSHTRPKAVRSWRLLIVDGHSSHIYWRVIQYALSRNIQMICLPPHSTHIMQPLDVGCFGVLAKAYKKHLRAWMLKNPTTRFNKEHFWEVLSQARDNTYTVETIQSAFKASGCWPINPWMSAPLLNKNTSGSSKTPPKPDATNTFTSISTPHKLKTLANQLQKRLTNEEDHQLLQQFSELSLGKLATYRDIKPAATTLMQLRSGAQIEPKDLRYVGKGRLLTRKEVNRGIEKLIKRKEDEQEVALKKKQPSRAQKGASSLQKAPTKAKGPRGKTTKPATNLPPVPPKTPTPSPPASPVPRQYEDSFLLPYIAPLGLNSPQAPQES